MSTPPKHLDPDDLLTKEVIGAHCFTEVGEHQATCQVATFVRLVLFAHGTPGIPSLAVLGEVELHDHDGRRLLSVGDFIKLASNSDLMRSTDLPADIVPDGQWTMGQVVHIERLRVTLQQALHA